MTTTVFTTSRMSTGFSAPGQPQCPVCNKVVQVPSRTTPDIVIPFYEDDLCKIWYTLTSIAIHDPGLTLNRVLLMWVSSRPVSDYQQQIDDVIASIASTHTVSLFDFSPHVRSSKGLGGWYAQQVLKLKIATRVATDFYIVLDAKNTLLRDLDEIGGFFSSCSQAKIHGRYNYHRIPHPHKDWYAKSAEALNMSAPSQGYWPPSITPMVMHTATVLDMLKYIGENPWIPLELMEGQDGLCDGPLCGILGARTRSGKGASEFTLYLIYAHAQAHFPCIHVVESTAAKTLELAVMKEAIGRLRADSGPKLVDVKSMLWRKEDLSRRWAVALWRGDENVEKNLHRMHVVAEGSQIPLMFGAQQGAFDYLPLQARSWAHANLVLIFHNAGLVQKNITTSHSEAVIDCIVGTNNTAQLLDQWPPKGSPAISVRLLRGRFNNRTNLVSMADGPGSQNDSGDRSKSIASLASSGGMGAASILACSAACIAVVAAFAKFFRRLRPTPFGYKQERVGSRWIHRAGGDSSSADYGLLGLDRSYSEITNMNQS